MSKIILLILLQISIAANIYFYYQLAERNSQVIEQSKSKVENFRGRLKVLTFYCSLHSSRDVIRFLDGRLTIWDKSSRSIQDTVTLKPNNTGTYKVLDSSLLIELSDGTKHDLNILEVSDSGEILSFTGNTIYKSVYCH